MFYDILSYEDEVEYVQNGYELNSIFVQFPLVVHEVRKEGVHYLIVALPAGVEKLQAI